MKHLHQLSLAAALSFVSLLGYAQQIPDSLNMVANGSFEEIEGKLRRLGGIESAKGWNSPTSAKADLYSESIDSNSPAYAPKNANGFQSALSGINYAGVLWYSYMDKEPRSYLQVKFKKMLKKGQKYCISYYVSLGELSKYSSDQLGAYVSRIVVNKKDAASLTYEAQVPDLKTKVYDDMEGWQGVCGVYEAKGDEQYLIIGNFAATDKVNAGKTRRPKGEVRPQRPNAYFFIDDVSVTPVKLLSECSCEQIDKDKSEFIYGRKVTANPGLTPTERVDRSVIYFKRFSKDIDPSMRTQMDSLASVLNANPKIKVMLTGHSDVKEVDRSSMRPDLKSLGKDRAESLKGFLVNAGIAADRISVADKGGSSPATEGDDEVSTSQNRRVEVDVVK
ncbi:MAG: OmpA family protein [Flavobacteriales bacterium]|nr:OmpA family protein [Flavobacteriales bacterium]